MKTEYIKNNFIKVPQRIDWDILKRGDKLIYANIKRHDGEQGCYPAIARVAQDSGCSTRRVMDALPRLIEAGMLSVEKVLGKSNRYYFADIEFFDKISPDFLDNDKISPQAKEYYMDLQQHLFINSDEGVANTTYSNTEIAKKLKLSLASVKRFNTELILAGMLTEKETNALDVAGFKKINKIFDLKQLCQWSLVKLKEHEESIKDNTERIEELEKAIDDRTLTKEEITEFRKLLQDMRTQKALNNNKTSEPNNYPLN